MLDVITKQNNFDNKPSSIQNLNQQIIPDVFIGTFCFVQQLILRNDIFTYQIGNSLSEFSLKKFILIHLLYITQMH